MKRITAFFLFGVLIISNSCQLPPSPNEPFYCKINGKKFRPGKDTSPIGGVGSSTLTFDKNTTDGFFYILARNKSDFIGISVKMKVNGTIEPGEYLFNGTANERVIFYSYNADIDYNETLKANYGKMIITEVSNKGLYGTFEFTAKSDKINKEFKITKGQFNTLR